MLPYIYMLLITVVCLLWQGIAKEQVDFFKTASDYTAVSMKYDYLYAVLENRTVLCSSSKCDTGTSVTSLSGYKPAGNVYICQNEQAYYAFYSSAAILTEKPPVDLNDSNYSVISVKNVPVICRSSSSDNNGDGYALKYSG